MKNLMPEWRLDHYFADSWILTRDGEEVGLAYKTCKEEAFFLFEKRVPKEEFDELLLKAAGMVVDWRYDSDYEKYRAVVSKVD